MASQTQPRRFNYWKTAALVIAIVIVGLVIYVIDASVSSSRPVDPEGVLGCTNKQVSSTIKQQQKTFINSYSKAQWVPAGGGIFTLTIESPQHPAASAVVVFFSNDSCDFAGYAIKGVFKPATVTIKPSPTGPTLPTIQETCSTVESPTTQEPILPNSSPPSKNIPTYSTPSTEQENMSPSNNGPKGINPGSQTSCGAHVQTIFPVVSPYDPGYTKPGAPAAEPVDHPVTYVRNGQPYVLRTNQVCMSRQPPRITLSKSDPIPVRAQFDCSLIARISDVGNFGYTFGS